MNATSLSPPVRGLRLWWMAIRPATLSAAVAPVAVGTALAASLASWSALTLVAALLGALLLQIGTNLANDLFDFRKGADTEDRLGPERATQKGWVTPGQMAFATALAFVGAAAVGAYLIVVGGWPVVAIGIASILAGLAYTGGPYPLGYHGLGDVTVFIFFGPVAVCGTWWVHTQTWSTLALLASIPVGALIAAILIVNNVRDRHTDAQAGKRTLAVRLGRRASLIQHNAQVIAAYLIVSAVAFTGAWGWLLPLLSLPLAIRLIRNVWARDGAALNPCLGETARLGLVFSLLLTLGVLL